MFDRRFRSGGHAPSSVLAVLAALLFPAACAAAPPTYSPADAASPLRLVRKIALPGVRGRIDHLAVDAAGKRLAVAEYGNGTVDVVDLAAGRVIQHIAGLHEPQGVALTATELAVACGDGTVHFYSMADWRQVAVLALGEDADNVRLDARNGHLVVGYGGGALAVIDLAGHRVASRTLLPGHPEGFQLRGSAALVNVPGRGAIVSADIDSGTITATWPTGTHQANFPMALDPQRGLVAVAYRFPAALQLRGAADGAVRATVPACGDADDLFIDGARLLQVCGAGHVDVVPIASPQTGPERVTTAPGARTGLFVPETGTLYVAAPARAGPAAIWALQTR